MELAQQYLMSMKRRELLKPFQLYNPSNFSWEEKAFADDTAGILGGIVWPPRSYSCSFCNREFRSAQALGGHMNVHRRDRARLKHSLVTSTTTASAASTSPGEGRVLQNHTNPNFSRVSSAMSSPKESDAYSVLAQKGSVCLNHGLDDDTKLCVGMNYNLDRGDRAFGSEEMSYKRPKTSTSLQLSLMLKPCSSDLDLELRLGDPPKVK